MRFCSISVAIVVWPQKQVSFGHLARVTSRVWALEGQCDLIVLLAKTFRDFQLPHQCTFSLHSCIYILPFLFLIKLSYVILNNPSLKIRDISILRYMDIHYINILIHPYILCNISFSVFNIANDKSMAYENFQMRCWWNKAE